MVKKIFRTILSFFSLEIRKMHGMYPLNCQKKNNRTLFDKYFSICSRESLNVSRERFVSLYQSVNYIYQNKIEGDFVECGVFRGGSSMMIAYCMNEFQKSNINKKLWMYDTYEGMTEANKFDVNILGEKAIHVLNKTKKNNNNKDIWAYSTLETVKKNMQKTNIKEDQYCFVKGPVEKTLRTIRPKKISLLRLDTDFYSSTKAELENLYDLVEKNGIIIIDDYGHWEGCKKAVDDFFRLKKNIFFQHIDYSAIIGIKLK